MTHFDSVQRNGAMSLIHVGSDFSCPRNFLFYFSYLSKAHLFHKTAFKADQSDSGEKHTEIQSGSKRLRSNAHRDPKWIKVTQK
jgi:hypothetical protein